MGFPSYCDQPANPDSLESLFKTPTHEDVMFVIRKEACNDFLWILIKLLQLGYFEDQF